MARAVGRSGPATVRDGAAAPPIHGRCLSMGAMPVLDTRTRPAPAGQQSPPARALAVSTCLAALSVAMLGLVPAVGLSIVGWILGSDPGSSADAVRSGAVLWLTAHGGAPAVAGTPISLVPLLVPFLLAAIGLRAGRWAVTSSGDPGAGWFPAAAGAGVGVGAATYATGVGLVGWAVHGFRSGSPMEVDVARAVALSMLEALLVLGVAVAQATGIWARAREQVPVTLGAVLRGAAAAGVTLLSCSAMVLIAALCVHADRMLRVGRELDPGPAGGLLLLLLCAATLPNAVLWTTSYLAGPGFAVGTGTVVAPGGVLIGPMPGYPLLAALPGPGATSGWVSVLTMLPVLAGLVGGVVCARTVTPGGLARVALSGAGAGAGAGVVLAGLMALSGGSVGPGRMLDSGPVPAASAILLVTVTLAAAVGAVGYRLLSDRWTPGPWARWRPGPVSWPWRTSRSAAATDR